MSNWIRQTHRWLSVIFTVAVIITTITLSQNGPEWVSYLPLPPLFLLLFSGLYLFALPYFAKRRGVRTQQAGD